MNLCKTIYRYVNEIIDEEKLIDELECQKDELKEYEDELEELIEGIRKVLDTYSGVMMRYQYTYELIMNNELYKRVASSMSNYELMDMITSHMMVRNAPAISQKTFDELVEEAIKHGKYPKEECWRLATNYAMYGMEFIKIIEYFIETRDVYYLGELISAVGEVLDITEIMTLVLETNDKEFIKEVKNNPVIKDNVNTSDLSILD